MPDYTILIIDYEPRSIRQLSTLFRDAGFRVEVARDGLKGIDAFDELRPDLALIEAMLPKKHGFEVCEAIKQTPHGKKTPVLILTSVYKGRRYRWQARYQYHCDDYLERPIDDRQLLDTVSHHLARSGRPPVEPVDVDEPVRPASSPIGDGKPRELTPDP
jgi:DNA-binding response OmpR family regulator